MYPKRYAFSSCSEVFFFFCTKFEKMCDENYLSYCVTPKVFTDIFGGTDRQKDGQLINISLLASCIFMRGPNDIFRINSVEIYLKCISTNEN